MGPNKALLKKTLEQIKAHPELHNQNFWVVANEENLCGTAMCFAGHAAVLSGAENPDPKKHFIEDWYVRKDNLAYMNYEDTYQVPFKDYESVSKYAGRELGLTSEQSDWLFDSNRTLEEIESAVEELITYGTLEAAEYHDDYDDYDYDDYCDCEECY